MCSRSWRGEDAERALLEALRRMPNHVESTYNPEQDVPALEQALRRVREVLWAATTEPAA